MKLSDRVERRVWGERVLLWNNATGRYAIVGEDDLEGQSLSLQRRLDRLGMLGTPDLGDHVVCRSRLVLCMPKIPALWVPVPNEHTPGGFGYRLIPLTDDELITWRAINDARTLAQLPGSTTFLSALTTFGTQAIQLRPARPGRMDPGLRRLVAPPRPRNKRTEDMFDDQGTSLGPYHLRDIGDAATQFDNRETTVAHSLEYRHVALGGRTYGEALFERILGQVNTPLSIVVEVGCGTGAIAAMWPKPGVSYLRVDLSPRLLAAQADRAPQSLGVLGDAVALPLRDESVDLLLSNEVLADLRSERRDEGWVNVGSWQFATEVARVLKPGGLAVLIEFGSPDQPPAEAEQLDHPEVSIDFGALARVASAAGLQIELTRLDEYLDVDLSAIQLSRHSWQGLRAWARSMEVHLEARAWSPHTLQIPWKIEGLEWVAMNDEGPGPLITRFWACVLRKPSAQ